jgi:hypothetical protein
MLKKRIRDWRLERNHKLPEMLNALQIAVVKQSRDNETVTIIRNQNITFAEIKRYFRRRGSRNAKADALDELEALTRISHDEAQRPLPNSEPRDLDAIASTGDTDTPLAIALPLIEQSKALEQLLKWCHAYCDSAMESSQWMMTTQRLRINQLERFYHNFVNGFTRLRAQELTDAFLLFGVAFDLILPLLKQNHLLFLPYICHILKGMPNAQHEGEEVVQSLFRLTSGLIEQNYPSLTPISRSFAALSGMNSSERSESSSRAYQAICNRLETLVSAKDSEAPTTDVAESQTICDSQHAADTDNYALALSQTTNAISELAHKARFPCDEMFFHRPVIEADRYKIFWAMDFATSTISIRPRGDWDVQRCSSF